MTAAFIAVMFDDVVVADKLIYSKEVWYPFIIQNTGTAVTAVLRFIHRKILKYSNLSDIIEIYHFNFNVKGDEYGKEKEQT